MGNRVVMVREVESIDRTVVDVWPAAAGVGIVGNFEVGDIGFEEDFETDYPRETLLFWQNLSSMKLR